MRTIEKTIYTYNELTDCAKDKAREWYRSLIETNEYSDSDMRNRIMSII